MASTSFGPDWQWPTNLPGRWSTDVDDDEQPTQSSSTSSHGRHESSSHDSTSQARPADQAGETPPPRHYGPRQCRICLEVVQPTYENPSDDLPEMLQGMPSVSYFSEDGGRLLRPCLCKGSQKYVHEGCLSAWRLQDPNNKRNYWQCPTCKYSYRLGRMTWAHWVKSTTTQIALTAAIFLAVIFVLGYVADPILDLFLGSDADVDLGLYSSFTDHGDGLWHLVDDADGDGWLQHLAKGFASLGLLGCAKLLWTINPFNFFGLRNYTMLGGGRAGSGRQRLQSFSWLAVVLGVITFLWVSTSAIAVSFDADIDRLYGKAYAPGAERHCCVPQSA